MGAPFLMNEWGFPVFDFVNQIGIFNEAENNRDIVQKVPNN